MEAGEHKGLDALITGFNYFYLKHSQGYLYLAGDGKDRYWLENKIRSYHLQDRIIFTGEIHGQQKQALISKVDIWVFSFSV